MKSKLAEIQAKVKAPKNQYNSFGKYKYRSCEDIVEGVKPIINAMGFYLTLSDKVVQIGDRYYIEAKAILSNGEESYESTAFAREEDTKKGMDASQITGSCSSYARKYALNGLFAIDDTKDADTEEQHQQNKKEEPPKTTLYNHKELGTDEKPLISNEQFKKLSERIQALPTKEEKRKLKEQALSNFTLTDIQARYIESLLI